MDGTDDPQVRRRLQGILQSHATMLREALFELRYQGFVPEVDVEVRLVPFAPQMKLYILNRPLALQGFYVTEEGTIQLPPDREEVAIYDAYGTGATLVLCRAQSARPRDRRLQPPLIGNPLSPKWRLRCERSKAGKILPVAPACISGAASHPGPSARLTLDSHGRGCRSYSGRCLVSRDPGARGGVYVRLPAAPTATAALGTSSVGAALLTGTVPADSPLVWPLVALALGSMAYDLGVRALGRRDR
ncbi:hypothetical protein [Streptomyces sp. P5_D11]